MAVLMLLVLFMLLVFMFDAIELFRRAAAKPEVSFDLVMNMALLKLPHMSQKILPFAVLFGGMLCFWRLTRSHELVVTRGAGVSAWQFLFSGNRFGGLDRSFSNLHTKPSGINDPEPF